MKTIVSLLIFVISLPLFPAEIVFPNGDAFLVEIVSEDSKIYRIKYRDNLYTIPKQDLEKVELLKSGKDKSYRYHSFILKDGSKLKGIVAEDTGKEYIIQSELGFVTLEKSRIQSELPDLKASISIDPKYSFGDSIVAETRIGVFGSVKQSPQMEPTTQSMGIYIEPAYLKFHKFQIGYKLQYDSFSREVKTFYPLNIGNNFVPISLISKSEYKFYHNIFYFQYPIQFSNPWLSFYVQLGAGTSAISYKGENGKNSGLEGTFLIEAGWQGWKWKNLYSRVSLKSICVRENSGPVFLNGIEFGIGIRL